MFLNISQPSSINVNVPMLSTYLLYEGRPILDFWVGGWKPSSPDWSYSGFSINLPPSTYVETLSITGKPALPSDENDYLQMAPINLGNMTNATTIIISTCISAPALEGVADLWMDCSDSAYNLDNLTTIKTANLINVAAHYLSDDDDMWGRESPPTMAEFGTNLPSLKIVSDSLTIGPSVSAGIIMKSLTEVHNLLKIQGHNNLMDGIFFPSLTNVDSLVMSNNSDFRLPGDFSSLAKAASIYLNGNIST